MPNNVPESVISVVIELLDTSAPLPASHLGIPTCEGLPPPHKRSQPSHAKLFTSSLASSICSDRIRNWNGY